VSFQRINSLIWGPTCLFIGSLFGTTATAPPNPSPCEHTWSSMSEAMTLREDSDIQPDELDSTGVYQTPDSSLRAFVTDSPKTPTHSRAKTQVDLVLPSLPAFNVPGPCNLFSPSQSIFLLIFPQLNRYYSGLRSLDSKALTGQQFSSTSNSLQRSGKDGSLLARWTLTKQSKMYGISSPKVRPSMVQMGPRQA
jgi:hypothetical protein